MPLLRPEDATQPPPEPAWKEFARAPLSPIAAAATVGLIVDRYLDLSLFAALAVGLGGLAAAIAGWNRTSAMGWLAVTAGGLAAAHHHTHRNRFASDDIGLTATDTPTPLRLRGTLDEEPIRYHPPRPDPLTTEPRGDATTAVLAVREIETREGWVRASGRVRLTIAGPPKDFHQGDLLELTGRIAKPPASANPGERDFREYLQDQRITAVLRVEHSAASVTRIQDGRHDSLIGQLGLLRGWGTRTLREALPNNEAGLASALLLGDTAALDREEWDAYVRTGVVHVLAISGQHLVVLAAFVWAALRIFDVRRRHGAWIVIVVMVGYTLLTGARPSAVRAAVMVCCVCLAVVLRRPVNAANSYALAWLVVIGLNPTDPFTVGCLLSFLSVLVLIWFLGPRLVPGPPTPVEQLIEESRTPTERIARWMGRAVLTAYTVSLVLAVANAPLILARQNLVSPCGVLLGPPVVLFASVALIAGFLLLLVAPLGSWAAWPFAWATRLSLAGCEELVHFADAIPGMWVYAPSPAIWWLAGFYLGVAGAVLCVGFRQRQFLLFLPMWVFAGLVVGTPTRTDDECRFTFLAVGHGCCVVIETPDGRVILYDAGTTTGPDAVRRVIAPYLWHRGVARIDEVFLSHADLDHFNGVPELLRRFHIGQVTVTPTFADKSSPGVEALLTHLERNRVPRRTATVCDRFNAGAVSFEVLHPPHEFLPGTENTRSLVLLARYASHSVLLTGDLEGEGQRRVQERSLPPVDVMLAPHHGARTANTVRRGDNGEAIPASMAAWARPRLVISSQRPGPMEHLTQAYGGVGATVWATPITGAVTVRCHSTGVIAEAFRTGEVRTVRRGE